MTENQKAFNLCKQVRAEMTDWYNNRVVKYYGGEEVAEELMHLRNYNTRQAMKNTLMEVGVTHIYNILDMCIVTRVTDYETHKLWGLYNETGKPIFYERYIVPIRDIQGQVTALVGYYPDNRKYVTTSTYGFRKSMQFFNAECYKAYIEQKNTLGGCKYVILVEGIYDTLAVRSLGLNVLGNMGLPLSRYKVQQLRRYATVVAIPDGDAAGKDMIPHFTHLKRSKSWNIENPHSYVRLKLDTVGVKDLDDLINRTNKTDKYLKGLLGTIPQTDGVITWTP